MVEKIVAVKFERYSPGVVVRWKIREHDLAKRWLASLHDALPYGMNERERLYDFPNQRWTRRKICDEMVDCMKKIETFYPSFFETWPDPDMDDNATNRMHVAFELLRGESFDPTDLYLNAPYHIQMEICRYNLLIHRWESFTRGGLPKVVCTFKNNHWNPFEPEDYQHFSVSHPYGALLLSYAQVGKQLIDVYRDGDDVVTSEGIRPMNGFAADFVAKFSTISTQRGQELYSSLISWYDDNSAYLQSIGLFKEDPRLAIGHIQIGDLIEEHGKDTLISKIGEHDYIKDVWIEG
jgi:hypothetical protein